MTDFIGGKDSKKVVHFQTEFTYTIIFPPKLSTSRLGRDTDTGHRRAITICEADHVQHFGFLDHYKINMLKTVLEKLPITSFHYSSIDRTLTRDIFTQHCTRERAVNKPPLQSYKALDLPASILIQPRSVELIPKKIHIQNEL